MCVTRLKGQPHKMKYKDRRTLPSLSEMEDGGIESLLQSERNVQGNSTYFSNGVEDGGDRIPGGYSIGGESGMSEFDLWSIPWALQL